MPSPKQSSIRDMRARTVLIVHQCRSDFQVTTALLFWFN